MEPTSIFLIKYGYILLFTWVFAEQMGFPIPAIPALLAAGALIGTGDLSLFYVVLLSMIAALSADLIWLGLPLGIGYCFHNQLSRFEAYYKNAGSTLGGLFVFVVISFIAWKYFRRQQLIRELAKIERISARELKTKLDQSEDITVLD